MTRCLVTTIAVLMAAQPCPGQDTIPANDLIPLSLIRVTAPPVSIPPIVARVKAITSTGLMIEHGNSTVIIPRGDITRLQRAVPRSRGRAIVTGAVVGGLAGFVVTKVWADGTYENDEYNVLGALVCGAAPGLVLGGIFGATRPTTRWAEFKVREWLEK